ncbi:helix-hairpin-helix domain-containing protein [Levilactobacillus namurensis]|uniref:helix-hairpin-helix domain-containing protein n=1 Tax=Levilactobacillus namurensis TaxID=380393 RepID=UPI0026EF9508|nr:helix-hairpin-helix domain-containing protein [Levilactobacillus namurensis]
MERLKTWWDAQTRDRQVIMGGLGILLVGLLGWFLLRPATPAPLPPATPPVNRAAQSSVTHSAGTTASQSSATEVVVDVQGAVQRPGLYRFKSGMRVADAVREAGGLAERADRQKINLATRLVDQQQLYLPKKGEKAPATNGSAPGPAGGSTPTSASSAGPDAPLNLNQATVTDLQKLSGIGAKKAQKIVDYRTEHGDFKTVNDLTQVAGFGEKTVARLQAQLTT